MGHFASHNTTDSGGRDYAVVEEVQAEAVPPTTRAFQDLQRMQAAGRIKHIGVSNFGVEQLKEALATGAKIAVNQVCTLLCAKRCNACTRCPLPAYSSFI